jgi:putative transposase
LHSYFFGGLRERNAALRVPAPLAGEKDPEQMVPICRQGESGVPVVEVCRQHGISEQTYYRWKKQLGDTSTSELKELRQLREENRKLKQLVADLSLDKTILREALTKSSDADPVPPPRLGSCTLSSPGEEPAHHSQEAMQQRSAHAMRRRRGARARAARSVKSAARPSVASRSWRSTSMVSCYGAGENS